MGERVVPTRDRLLVKPVVRDTFVLHRSLYTPTDDIMEKRGFGVADVVEVGEGVADNRVLSGTRIWHTRFSGQEVTVEEELHMIVAEKDLLCIVED